MVKKFFRNRSIGIPFVPSVPSIFFLYNVDHIRLRNMDIPNDAEEAEEEIPEHISDIVSRASKTLQDNSESADAGISQVPSISTSVAVAEPSFRIVDKDADLMPQTLPSTSKNKQDEITLKMASSGYKPSKPKDISSEKISAGQLRLESSKIQERGNLVDSSVAHHIVDRYEKKPAPKDSDDRKEGRKMLPKGENQKLPLENKSCPSPPDTGFVKPYSSQCSKHPEGRRIVPNIKPKLCDSCTVSMLSYVSVLQDFLKSMSQDIVSQQAPSSQCFECAKERLLISTKSSLETHDKHNASPDKPEDTFDSKPFKQIKQSKSFALQDPKREPSKYHSDGHHKRVLETEHRPTSFDSREIVDINTRSETSDRNVEAIARAKSQFISENHLASSETQVNNKRLEDQPHAVLQHPPGIEDIPRKDEEQTMQTPSQHVEGKDQDFFSHQIRDNQAFISQQINDHQVSPSQQVCDDQISPSQQVCDDQTSPSRQVSDQHHYYNREELTTESREEPVISESETRTMQNLIQPNFFGDQISPPTRAVPYTSSSPFSPRNNKDGILSALSNEEREVYDSARGVAGWERMTEPNEGQDLSYTPPRTTDEAFVTIAGTNAEAMSCLVLGCSLLLCRTSRILCVLITDGVSAALRAPLSSVFHVVQSVRSLDSLGTTKLSLLDQPDLGVFFRKLHVWRLVQFSKCVFLNPDTMVVQNCDELFCHEELSAVPDIGWPDCFNSGMFVYQPSVSTFWKLVEFAENQGSYDGGDQGLLNSFFSTWSKDIHKKLSFIYNLMANVSYTYTPAFKRFGRNVKIVQFQGAYKPWHVKFYTETGQISPSSVVHPTYVQFVHVWIKIFKIRVIPLFSQEIQSYATSQSLISSSELLRFFPSESGTELEFLLSPPSVRTRHDPQTPIPIVRNTENTVGDLRQIRRRSLTFQQDTEVDPPAFVRKSRSEEDMRGKPETRKESLDATLSTEEAAVVEQISEDSQLEVSDPSPVIGQKEAESRHLIPGSDLGDYQGMAAWEQGRMDYMGSASSDVILRRLLYLMEKSDRLV